MKTTLNLADYLVAEVKRIAAERQMTMKDYIEQCLREAIQAEKQKSQNFVLRKHPFKGKGISKDFSEDDWESIRGEVYKGREKVRKNVVCDGTSL